MDNFTYILIAFIVVMIVVLTAESLLNSMLIVALLANFLAIVSQFMNINKHTKESGDEAAANLASTSVVGAKDGPEPVVFETVPTVEKLYSEDFYEYDSFKAPVVIKQRSLDVDTAGAEIALARFKQKQAMDGATLKTADFYKYHFQGELEAAQGRDWWGQSDY